MVPYNEQFYLCLYCCRLSRSWYKMVSSFTNSQKSVAPTRISGVQCVLSFFIQCCGYCPSKVSPVPQFDSFPFLMKSSRKLKRFFPFNDWKDVLLFDVLHTSGHSYGIHHCDTRPVLSVMVLYCCWGKLEQVHFLHALLNNCKQCMRK